MKLPKLSEGSFGYNVGILSIGNILAVAISTAAIPIISRVYSATDYGVFGMVMAILAILTPVSTLRADAAIVLPRSDRAAAALYSVGLRVLLAFSLCLAVLILLAPPTLAPSALAGLIGHPGFTGAMVGVLLMQSYSLMSGNWLLRKGLYRQIGAARVGEALFEKSSAIFIGLVVPGAWGLLIARFLGSAFLASATWKFLGPVRPAKVTAEERRELVGSYQRHLKLAPLTVLLGQASQWLPMLLAGTLFPSAIAGFFFLGRQMLAMPLTSIGRAIQRALMREASVAPDSAGTRAKCEQILAATMPGLCVLSSGLFLFGPSLVDRILGPGWEGFGHYAAVLSIGYGASFIHLSVSGLFDVFQAHGKRIWLDLLLLILRLGVFLPAALDGWSPLATFWAFSAVTAIIYLAGVAQILRIVGFSWLRIWDVTLRFLLVPTVTCLALLAVIQVSSMTLVSLMAFSFLVFANILISKRGLVDAAERVMPQ